MKTKAGYVSWLVFAVAPLIVWVKPKSDTWFFALFLVSAVLWTWWDRKLEREKAEKEEPK